MFADPDAFDITREPAGQPQLTFGSGIHYCLGAALARAELQEALPILARRMPDLALDGPITWKPNAVGIFGPDHLPVTLHPRPLTPNLGAIRLWAAIRLGNRDDLRPDRQDVALSCGTGRRRGGRGSRARARRGGA